MAINTRKNLTLDEFLALPEWRCTRIGLYPAGVEKTDMQGHYIRAATKAEALRLMQAEYPGEAIEADLWKPGRTIPHVCS